MFGRKKKTEGRRLSVALTMQERNTIVACLVSMTVVGGTEGIRSARSDILPVVKADEPLIPGVIQGLINICNTMADLPDAGREAKNIARKLKKLL